MKTQALQNKALQMADSIFSNGRIDDPENWDEMENELEFEMSNQGFEGKDRQQILTTVYDRWYEEKR